jgi:hypothetical protein
VNSNPLPSHDFGSEGVNALEIGRDDEIILRVTMERLYVMLK